MAELRFCGVADRPQSKGAWVVPSVEDLRRILVRPEDQTIVHISRSCVCDRFAFRGVPARSVDVCVDRRIMEHSADDLPMLVTRSQKRGKYDHHVRDRWLIRRINTPGLGAMRKEGAVPNAEIMVTASPRSVGIRILVDDRVATRADYDRLPAIGEDYDQWACVRRNWTRYYQHLNWGQVEEDKGGFVPMPVRDDDTLSELNQWCCHWLTQRSYSLGWSRVIAPAATRKGLPLWNRDGGQDDVGNAAGPLEAIQDRLESVQ